MFNPLTRFSSDSIELERHQQGQAFINLWSSLSGETQDAIEARLSDLGLSGPVATFKQDDLPAGRSVHYAADRAQITRDDELAGLKEVLDAAAEVHTIAALDGTGVIGTEAYQPFAGTPLDQITKFNVVSPNPTIRERICRSFNLATAGRDNVQNVLISKDSHDETPRYPAELAELSITTLFIDSMNLFDSAVVHDTVSAGDVVNTGDEIQSALFRKQAELGHPPSGALGFSADTYLPPGESVCEDEVWSDSPYRGYVVYPKEYQGTGLTDDLVQDDDLLYVNSHPAPVDEIRMLVSRELDDGFMSRVKTSNIQWLYEQADSLDAWQKEINCECSPRTDPQEEVVRFLTAELNVYDDEVLDALREVGADV